MKLFRYFAHITKVSETSCYDEIFILRDTDTTPKELIKERGFPDFRGRIATEIELDRFKWANSQYGFIGANHLFDCQIPVVQEDIWIEMPDSSVYSRSLNGFKPCKWCIDFDLYIVGLFGMWKIKTYKGYWEEDTWKRQDKREKLKHWNRIAKQFEELKGSK